MSFFKRFQVSLESLIQFPENSTLVIAYSGGVDSHVLLHCCSKLNFSVRAVHVHHGIQRVADDWVVHCQKNCDLLAVHLDTIYVDGTKKQHQSPEESARKARYDALYLNLRANEYLLTAQHVNDQAETLLLQLFRTASSAGLAAMPAIKRIREHFHLRPLLSFSRQDIERYAVDKKLQWLEDPSNLQEQFDRNFIRKKIMPLLETRWPAVTRQLSTVADLQSNNLQVLEDMAAIDLASTIKMPEQVLSEQPLIERLMAESSAQQPDQWSAQQSKKRSSISAYDVVSVLSISRLKKLSSSRLLNCLRYWVIHTLKNPSTDVSAIKISPTRKLLKEIESTLVNSKQDAKSVITFAGFEYRRYQDGLYLLKPGLLGRLLLDQLLQDKLKEEIIWNPSAQAIMPLLNGHIQVIETTGAGLQRSLHSKNLRICFRQGGERFRPAGRQHSHSLKKLFQEAGIPPWERSVIPLLYYRDELIAVIGHWYCKHYAVAENEPGWIIKTDVLIQS